MKQFSISVWTKISLFSLAIVATLGVLMRYKIGYSLPWLDQKHLQHAHSHFAFAGWVSLALMALMVEMVRPVLAEKRIKKYQLLLAANLVCAWGMLVAFMVQGYALFSIAFSTGSILVAYLYAFSFWKDLSQARHVVQKGWFRAALIFNLLSTLGTFWLIYMMATKHLPMHNYLASVYWYLHFQYNGWFFFACMGLFIHFVTGLTGGTPPRAIFLMMGLSCLPAYGLSVLWLNLPVYIYVFVVAAAAFQFAGWLGLVNWLLRNKFLSHPQLRLTGKLLMIFISLALTLKLCLQLGSVHPELSKLAFGFRPIVIAYLHLALLAIITVFLVAFFYNGGFMRINPVTHAGIFAFVTGIFLNEGLLAVQGVASLSYTMVPGVNAWLFVISLLMLTGVLLILLSQTLFREKRL